MYILDISIHIIYIGTIMFDLNINNNNNCSDAGWLVRDGEDDQIFHYFWLHFGQI